LLPLKNIRLLALIVSTGVFVAGCAKAEPGGNRSTSVASQPVSVPQVARADAAHGKVLFAANCAVCHGDHGTEGGVGPSLQNEHMRKNRAAAIAWIKNPQPPMSKLYPGTLSERDVADVAAFVETL